MLLARHTAHWHVSLHAVPGLYMYGMLFAQRFSHLLALDVSHHSPLSALLHQTSSQLRQFPAVGAGEYLLVLVQTVCSSTKQAMSVSKRVCSAATRLLRGKVKQNRNVF